jgi:hypothetical protein
LYNLTRKEKGKKIMNYTIPNASTNTGVFKTNTYAEGDYTLEIKKAAWDLSKEQSDQKVAIKLETIIIDGPIQDDGKPVKMGATFNTNLNQRLAVDNPDNEWMIEADTTAIVQLCNALGLKVPKTNIIPVDKMAGLTVVATIKHSKPNADGKVFANVRQWKKAEE